MKKSNIYCIWYPAGGFGHFINAILSLHGTGFERPYNKRYKFSQQGNSHALPLVAPKYFHDRDYQPFDFKSDQLYSVLVDNGTDSKSKKFLNVFPGAHIIKMCYTNYSWPVIAKTMVVKAMNRKFEEVVINPADFKEPWELRERYFLYLRDHILRHEWPPESFCQNILLEDLAEYQTLKTALKIETSDFEDLWSNWWAANQQYYNPIITARNIINGKWPLEPVTDIWTQAVLYYQIWCRYGFEVPHNDYSNWFESQQEFVTMLRDHGVTIDQI